MIAFDLGSNTLRAVRIECQTHERIKQYEKIVKTAEGLMESKNISQEATKRVIEAIKNAKKAVDFSEDESYFAVATAAFRMAKNADLIIKEIESQTGIIFNIIGGDDEAFFTSIAAKESLRKLDLNRDFMLIDIGGGSTEITFSSKGKILSESFELGIVTCTPKDKKSSTLKNLINKKILNIKEFIRDSKAIGFSPKLFCATAGTPTTVAASKLGIIYSNYDYKKINGEKLTLKDLDTELNKLLKLSIEDREKVVGVGRAELIITGIYIFEEIFKISGFDECIVIDDGLREGVAIAKCQAII